MQKLGPIEVPHGLKNPILAQIQKHWVKGE